jgi:transposase
MGSARNAEAAFSAPATKQRSRSRQERREIVEETLQPGASVAVIARQHDVNANQVFHWRKLYREGRLEVTASSAQLLPVRVTEVVQPEQPPAELPMGSIVVELGRARIRIEASKAILRKDSARRSARDRRSQSSIRRTGKHGEMRSGSPSRVSSRRLARP